MGILEKETDFPRGKVIADRAVSGETGSTKTVKKEKRKVDADDTLFGDGTKKVKGDMSKNKKKSETNVEDKAWKNVTTLDLLTEGVMGAGIVREISEDQLMLETVDSCRVNLPATQISKKFTDLLKADQISMEDVFVIGQIIPFRVTSPMVDNGAKNKVYPIVTCDPAKLNSHLNPACMYAGLVIHSIVESIEEKGAILDIGLQSLKGFLPTDKYCKAIAIGHPLIVRVDVQGPSVSRVLKVTSFVEQDSLSSDHVELNNLMPGTIIEADPGENQTVGSTGGLNVKIGNGINAFISRRNLPPRLSADKAKVGRSLRCVVMLTKLNSNMLVLSAHPDIVAVSKPDTRSHFEGFDIGDIITGTVSYTEGHKFAVCFSLPLTADGKTPLVTAFSSKAYLENYSQIDSCYKVGSQHQLRVVDVRLSDRSLVVATKKAILKQKIVSYKDAAPGEIVQAKVVRVHSKGIIVSLYDMVRGFIPIHHAFDKPTDIDRVYAEGKLVNLRVLFPDHMRKQIVLTGRQSLLSFKGTRITSYDESLVGQVTVGIIVRILPSGGFLVLFYNSIKGLVQASEAKRMGGNVKLNQAVEVRVTSVDPEENRMILALADESLKSASDIVRPQPFVGLVGTEVYSAEVTDVVELGLAHKRSEKVDVKILPNDNVKEILSATLLSSLVSDALDVPFDNLKDVFCKDLKLDKVAAMGALSGANRVTAKRFVCDWLSSNSNNVPKTFSDLRENQLICGVVWQRLENGQLFIEVAGGSGLVGRIAALKVPEGEIGLQVDQTVLGRIGKIDSAKKTFVVSCVPSLCIPENGDGPTVAKSLLKSCVDEIIWMANNSASGPLPPVGSSVIATVSHIVDDILFVKFGTKLTGCVRKGNYDTGIKVGDKVNCLVIDYKVPSNDAELVQFSTDNVNNKKTKKAMVATDSRVVLVKRDYIAVLTGHSLCYVPARLHPNIVLANIKSASVELGDKVELHSIEQLGSSPVSIGLLAEDNIRLKQLSKPTLVAMSKSSLKKTFPGKTKVQGNSDTAEDAEADNGNEGADEKENISSRTKLIKKFKIYTAPVVGYWDLEGANHLSAKVKMPGDSWGRLHISELPSSYLQHENAMTQFLKDYKNKTANVKVIDYSSIAGSKTAKVSKKVRISELTMNEDKMSVTQLRGRLMQYQCQFKTGDIVKCFAVGGGTKNDIELKVEVNPKAIGKVPRECLSEDLLVEQSKSSALVDLTLEEGEVRNATVQHCVRGRNNIIHLTLRLLNKDESNIEEPSMKTPAAQFTFGEKLPGRVVEVNTATLTVTVQLPNGIHALITPTAISNKYEKIHQHIGNFHEDEVFHLVALRRQDHPRKYFVITEGRYDAYIKEQKKLQRKGAHSESQSGLLIDKESVTNKFGEKVHGVVVEQTSKSTYVEISPGFHGRLVKKSNSVFADLPLNSVVLVKLLRFDDEDKLILAFDSTNHKPSIAVKSARKRSASQCEAEENVKKTKKLEDVISEPSIKATVCDPGFDWSNTGFLPEDLAAVGKLVDDEKPKEATEEKMLKPAEKKKKGEKNVKSLTKEERVLQKERELSARETALSGEHDPETDADFALLLRKDPNSADAWIKYISFFLGKSDLVAARATAERALTVINHREQAELLNVWFAYLNMEVCFGDSASTRVIFERACNSADSLRIHRQMAAIYVNNHKIEEANEVFETMVRKFRASSDDVWVLYAEHLMSTDRQDKARELLQRALVSVPKHRHTSLVSRFAQLEYRKGDAGRGQTLFEGLINAYPKKTDIWTVYADLALKYSGIESARQILERACGLTVNIHKLRPLFKKWMDAEEKHGDAQSQQLVRAKAERYLQSQNDEE